MQHAMPHKAENNWPQPSRPSPRHGLLTLALSGKVLLEVDLYRTVETRDPVVYYRINTIRVEALPAAETGIESLA